MKPGETRIENLRLSFTEAMSHEGLCRYTDATFTVNGQKMSSRWDRSIVTREAAMKRITETLALRRIKQT